MRRPRLLLPRSVKRLRVSETAVYRLYDADGALLYVGVARSPRERLSDHAYRKPWWPQVARKTIEWHPDRETALEAEARAIHTEHPVHNRQVPVIRDVANVVPSVEIKFMLPSGLYERLREAAFTRRVSRSDLVRESLEVRLAEIEAEAAAGAG